MTEAEYDDEDLENEDEESQDDAREDALDKEETDDLRSRIKDRIDSIQKNFVFLGRELYMVDERKVYQDWGYATFEEYRKAELSQSKRTCQRLRQCWRVFVKKLGVKQATLLSINYSNALLVLPVINNQNKKIWLDKAKVLPYGALEEEVARSRAKDSDDDETIEVVSASGVVETVSRNKNRMIRRSFSLFQDQEEILDAALEEAERSTNNTHAGEKIAMICTAFLAGAAKGTDKKSFVAYLLAKLNRLYGGKFIHLEDEEGIRAYEEALADPEDLLTEDGNDD